MHTIVVLDIGIYIPVILEIILLLALLFIPLPIVFFIYKNRKEKVGGKTTSTDESGNSFVATGKFKGFNISASGSVALYFILFTACLSASIPIVNSIEKTQSDTITIGKLNFSMDSLLQHAPWKLMYTIKIKSDDPSNPQNEDYSPYLNIQHFHSFPPAIKMDAASHNVSCYLDNDIIASNGYNYTVNIDNLNASFQLHIDSSKIMTSSRTIDLGPIELSRVPLAKAPYNKSVSFTNTEGLDKTQLPINPLIKNSLK